MGGQLVRTESPAAQPQGATGGGSSSCTTAETGTCGAAPAQVQVQSAVSQVGKGMAWGIQGSRNTGAEAEAAPAPLHQPTRRTAGVVRGGWRGMTCAAAGMPGAGQAALWLRSMQLLWGQWEAAGVHMHLWGIQVCRCPWCECSEAGGPADGLWYPGLQVYSCRGSKLLGSVWCWLSHLFCRVLCTRSVDLSVKTSECLYT